MARLGYASIQAIKKEILDDLYGAQEKKFDERRAEIARQNRELFMKTARPIIEQLPRNLFNKQRSYQLYINYKLDPADFSKGVYEIWHYHCQDGAINPPMAMINYSKDKRNARPGNLEPELSKEAAELCEEIIVLRTEKNKMEAFLDSTFEHYTGTLQLRKVLPESLHKYLPAEPVKGVKAKPLKVETPDFLKVRQTSNLIKGN